MPLEHDSNNDAQRARNTKTALDRLAAARDFSAEGYYLPLGELVEQALPAISPEAMQQLTSNTDFRSQVVSPDLADPQAPIAFRADTKQLAQSAAMLKYVEAIFTGKKPVTLAEVCDRITDVELRSAFEADIQRKQKTDDAPDFLAAVSGDRIESLASDMLVVLAAQRKLGDDDYPLTLRQLADLTRPGCTDKQVLDAAARNNIFQKKALLAVRKDIDSPTVLAEDAVILGESDLLLRFLLTRSRTKNNHAFSVPELAKRLTTARRRATPTAFRTAIERRIQEDELPPDIGCLWINGAIRLFFLHDVFPASVRKRLEWPSPEENYEEFIESISESELAQLQEEFEQAFDEAFEIINRRSGGHNFVSLVDLRDMLDGFSRTRFDAELRRLRREGRYTLSSTQSRHGIRGAEREAAIQEEGLMLLHVSRRES